MPASDRADLQTESMKETLGSFRETPQISVTPEPIWEEIPGPDGVIVAEGLDQGLLDEFRASMEKERKRRERWPRDYRLAMSEMAKLFPTMRGVPGTDPWNVEKLIAWLNTGAPTSGSWHAVMFLLGVWNPHTKWNKEGVRMRKGASGKFDMFAALAVWDGQHLQAMQEWIAAPFWP